MRFLCLLFYGTCAQAKKDGWDIPYMFMPHGYRRSTGEFQRIDNGVSISRYYQTIQEIREKNQDQNIDSHDRFFNMARAACDAGKVLEYFGQNPFIIRSSSFLEDGFGNAFAGKYES